MVALYKLPGEWPSPEMTSPLSMFQGVRIVKQEHCVVPFLVLHLAFHREHNEAYVNGKEKVLMLSEHSCTYITLASVGTCAKPVADARLLCKSPSMLQRQRG